VLVHIQSKIKYLSYYSRSFYFRCLPDFPHLDNEYDQIALIAFPLSIQNRDRDIIWLLCEDIQDLK